MLVDSAFVGASRFIDTSVNLDCCLGKQLHFFIYSFFLLVQNEIQLDCMVATPPQCVRYQSHRTLFSQLRENRTKITAIGSGCTLATEPAAEISHFWNIPQVLHRLQVWE